SDRMCKDEQSLRRTWIARFIAAALVISICAPTAKAQERVNSSILVQVFDQQNSVIIGARVVLHDGAGRQTYGTTNQEGKFLFSDLVPGNYNIQISAEYFRTYQSPRIQVASGGETANLKVTLSLAGVEESISVFPDTSVGLVGEYIGGNLVIRG